MAYAFYSIYQNVVYEKNNENQEQWKKTNAIEFI